MTRERMRKVAAALAATAGLLLGPAAAGMPAAAAPVQAASNPDCVSQIPIKSVDSITPDGKEVALTAGLARLYHYDLSGTPASQVVAPDGWSPLKATDTELRTYGYPPRPAVSNSQALAQWNADASAWHPAAVSGPPQLCETSFVSQVGAHASAGNTVRPDSVVSTSTNISWAGGEALRGTGANIWTTDNRWTQPAFTSNACTGEERGSDAAYAVWGGIGGDNTQNLIQAGVETSAADGLVNRPFFNYLTAGTATTHGDVKWFDVTAAGGDDLESWVYYQASDNTAHFNVIDHTRSWSKSIYIGSGSSYWDPTTADFISEAPMKGSLPVPLLRPAAAGQILLYSMTVNGAAIASFGSEQITQKQGSLVIQYTNFDGAHPWYNTWNDCFN